MVSERIAYRSRKITRREIKCPLPALNSANDASAASDKIQRSGYKPETENERTNGLNILCQNVGFILPVKGERIDDRGDLSGENGQPSVIGQVQVAAKGTKKGAVKRKRKSPGKAADSAVVESVSVAAPLDAKNECAVQGHETVVSVTVTSLLEPGVLADAISHLKSCDPKLKELIETLKPPSFPKAASAFSTLVRSIVNQQLGTKAAAAIFKRLVDLCGGDALVTPSTILELGADELRKVGLSFRKASYLHDLARNFALGELTDASIPLMEDAKLMSTLTAVKGIGTWSVHMFMIFSLYRPDVLPVGDLGVRKGFQKLYNLPSLPSPTEMEKIAAPWRPYRSLGSWYMWLLMAPKPPLATSQDKS